MQGNDSFRLIVRRGPQPNQTYDLNKDIVTVGRDITNDIVINDPEVSRHHLRFTRGAGGFTLEDLASTNGTFINGQRLSGAKPLNNGDMINLGETVTLGYEAVRPQSDLPPEDGGGSMPTMQSPAQESPAPQPSYQPAAPVQPQPEPQPAQPQPGYNQQPLYNQTPPPATGYYEEEYEEEGGTNPTLRFVLIGCVSLTVFCCCATVIALVIIDQQCLWDQIPIFGDVLGALGFGPDPNLPQCL